MRFKDKIAIVTGGCFGDPQGGCDPLCGGKVARWSSNGRKRGPRPRRPRAREIDPAGKARRRARGRHRPSGNK